MACKSRSRPSNTFLDKIKYRKWKNFIRRDQTAGGEQHQKIETVIYDDWMGWEIFFFPLHTLESCRWSLLTANRSRSPDCCSDSSSLSNSRTRASRASCNHNFSIQLLVTEIWKKNFIFMGDRGGFLLVEHFVTLGMSRYGAYRSGREHFSPVQLSFARIAISLIVISAVGIVFKK